MIAGAASARGVRRAKARDRAGEQNCCKKGLHVSSVVLGRTAAPNHDAILRFDKVEYLQTSNAAEPSDGHLNAK
jgi:hypothetical protein